MSPSRGLRLLPLARRSYSTTTPPKTPIELLRLSPHRLHIYRSNSTNPFFNLSAEDYLLRHSPPTSTLLFTYTNTPSIILGRNQNIWSEVNIPLLNTPPYNSTVQLVRRRSGGGTVYHDLGNLCWSVIMPRKAFDRDFYANVVVKALHSLGVTTAMVNERHDIILRKTTTSPDTGKTKVRDKKVSGSAYKIIRERAYHHATLLLNSDLGNISALLRSPLKEFITTKGVESVRSPVENIGVGKEELVGKIEEEFLKANGWKEGDEEVGRAVLEEEETVRVREYIREGMMELQVSRLYPPPSSFFCFRFVADSFAFTFLLSKKRFYTAAIPWFTNYLGRSNRLFFLSLLLLSEDSCIQYISNPNAIHFPLTPRKTIYHACTPVMKRRNPLT
ncbi:Biotin/lipoate A/B protein ligase [Orbilia oligospora]|nr:Biotin/lipoate A/B protein ligase [Orbilia oligospora]